LAQEFKTKMGIKMEGASAQKSLNGGDVNMEVNDGLASTKLASDFQHKLVQFHHLYHARLRKLRPLLEHAKWGLPDEAILQKISDVSELIKREQKGRECVITGVLLKRFKKRKDVFHLESLLVEKSLVIKHDQGNAVYVDETDTLVLEDETSWIKINGLDPTVLVTGIVVALRGSVDSNNNFCVKDTCFCRIDSPPRMLTTKGQSGGRVAFISGQLSPKREELAYLVDFFDKEKPSMIVICGGLMGTDFERYSDIDTVFAVVSRSRPVLVMSGENDPVNGMLPYMPMSKIFFPKCSAQDKFELCTNPHEFQHGGATFLGTSGENVTDALRGTKVNDSVQILKSLLQARHIAPTAPDTLPCLPHKTDDVLTIDKVPRVFFAGNQQKFGVESFQGVTLLSIPTWSQGRGAAFLSLDDPDKAEFISF